MSGHSHWKTIKAKKGSEDARKSKLFSKYSRLISVAARGGSANPEENFKLKQAIDQAREVDMPSDTIVRAIKKGTGELEGIELQEITLEAYGPAKTAVVVEGITDNKNRTIAEVKQILSKNGGKLAEPGSVKYLFNRKGILTIDIDEQSEHFKNKDELELGVIDAGAEDVDLGEGIVEVYTQVEDFKAVQEALAAASYKIANAQLSWLPQTTMSLDASETIKTMKLLEALEELDDVQEVFSNLDIADDIIAEYEAQAA